MAGERKGKVYEALIYVALQKIKKRGQLEGEIFWNETPQGMSIEPDLMIGEDIDHPRILFLITHSTSTRNSDMKFWRNIGELVEIKVRLPTVPRVYNVAFDAEIKDSLKDLQAVAFDGQLIVGDRGYGRELQKWVEDNASEFPSSSEEKVTFIENTLLASNNTLSPLFEAMTIDLGQMLQLSNVEMETLWLLERQRTTGKAPISRETYARRGLAKAALIREVPQKPYTTIRDTPQWMQQIGLVKKVLGGYRVTDAELLWVTNSELSEVDLEKLLQIASTEGFRNQLTKVRSLVLLSEFSKYVITNLEELKQAKGMLKHLRMQHALPTVGISIPSDIELPQNVWLFDFISALLKAKKGKSQGFGYSHFAKHPKAKSSQVGSMDIGTWCSCFINQYFTRKSDFELPAEVEEFVAEVLAEQLAPFTSTDIAGATQKILEQYIAKEYEATLLAHRGFDPIGGLLEIEVSIPLSAQTRVRGAFAERAFEGGITGSTTVAIVKNSIVYWRSAHESHTSDKKKELIGRAVALRYCWDSEADRFVNRPGIKKLILVVDGTWRQEELDALARAGWDEIFYPDQLDKVAGAIV